MGQILPMCIYSR